ncbi:MAG: hypothetical protein KDM63_00770 [Verrucomicrobiae bacterium]|nr:hypothetical protein [Verrucomicrobiae bacterium]MCB1085550.1 hypothetical protein [Verrucomicrobiae bacterium]
MGNPIFNGVRVTWKSLDSRLVSGMTRPCSVGDPTLFDQTFEENRLI